MVAFLSIWPVPRGGKGLAFFVLHFSYGKNRENCRKTTYDGWNVFVSWSCKRFVKCRKMKAIRRLRGKLDDDPNDPQLLMVTSTSRLVVPDPLDIRSGSGSIRTS